MLMTQHKNNSLVEWGHRRDRFRCNGSTDLQRGTYLSILSVLISGWNDINSSPRSNYIKRIYSSYFYIERAHRPMPPIIDSDVFYSPDDLSGDIAEIEATLRKHVNVSSPIISRSTRSVQWGSSLKLNFDVTASPSWVGTMLSSPHFAQRYRESNERQRHDILASFPSLARDFSVDCALSPPPILKQETRYSKTKELARPIMRPRGHRTKSFSRDEPMSLFPQSCNEAIFYCSLSSPSLSSTDDESDDSDTATLLNSPQTTDSKGGFDRVRVLCYEPTPEKKITGRVCL